MHFLNDFRIRYFIIIISVIIGSDDIKYNSFSIHLGGCHDATVDMFALEFDWFSNACSTAIYIQTLMVWGGALRAPPHTF